MLIAVLLSHARNMIAAMKQLPEGKLNDNHSIMILSLSIIRQRHRNMKRDNGETVTFVKKVL